MGYQRRQHRILRTDYAAEKIFHDPDGLVEYEPVRLKSESFSFKTDTEAG